MITSLDEITVQKLDEVAESWEETRLRNLARDEVTALAREYANARMVENRIELQCTLRARRMYQLGFDKKEIAQLFRVERRKLNKWLKGMD